METDVYRKLQRHLDKGARHVILTVPPQRGEQLDMTGLLAVVDDVGAIPRGLRGMAATNPVNLPPEAGVQVEVPGGARAVLRPRHP